MTKKKAEERRKRWAKVKKAVGWKHSLRDFEKLMGPLENFRLTQYNLISFL